MTVFEFLEKAKEVGAECVQIADNIPLHDYAETDLLKIRAQADKLNLAIEVGFRGLTLPQINQYLRICQLLDADLLRVVIDAGDYQPSVEKVGKLIEQVEPQFCALRIKLAIENHDRLSAHDFVKILENTDSDYVGICLDSVNSLGKGEGFLEVANQLIPHIICLHVKDYKIERKTHNMGFEVYGTIAGQGMLPIPWLFKEIEKRNQCRSAILELWPPPEANIELTILKECHWLEESMKYLKSLS
jgi:sugar phosphate isomerase/epimerase